MSLRDTVNGMATLAGERGKTHRWWAAALAMKDLLDNASPEQLELAEEIYEKRVED